MAILTRMEKMLFPCFLLIFEAVFLVLYGLLVKYDDLGAPVIGNATASSTGEGHFSAATAGVVSVYPCKLLELLRHFSLVFSDSMK